MKREIASDTDPASGAETVTEPIVHLAGESASGELKELDPKTARILKALDRPPRPPAPVPERRASSEGGDFVAYSSSPHPPGVAVKPEEVRRQEALAALSALVQQPPAEDTQVDVSTATLARIARSRNATWALALLAVLVVAVAVIWGAATTTPVVAADANRPEPPPAVLRAAPPQKAPIASAASESAAPSLPSPASQALPSAPTPQPSTTSAPPPPVRRPATPAPSSVPRLPPKASSSPPPDNLIEHPW